MACFLLLKLRRALHQPSAWICDRTVTVTAKVTTSRMGKDGRSRERGYMYTYSFRIWDVCIHTADSLCCKAETQHRKAITLQLKKKKMQYCSHLAFSCSQDTCLWNLPPDWEQGFCLQPQRHLQLTGSINHPTQVTWWAFWLRPLAFKSSRWTPNSMDWSKRSPRALSEFLSHANHEIIMITGLPWWSSGWEYPCQCRGHVCDLWSRKIPHAAEQLSPGATTEPTPYSCWSLCTLQPALCNEKPPQWEAHAPQQRPSTAKNK